MNRSPLFYPMTRGMDAEAGGAADLQTDVMRFMAILSMCLVAIFALVQSIPLAPAPSESTVSEPVPVPGTAVSETREPAREVALIRPAPAKVERQADPVALQRPKPAGGSQTVTKNAPVPSVHTSIESSAQDRSTPGKVQNGFTLRFESDEVLTKLVAQQVVGLYAISPGKSSRLSVEGDVLSFWTASTPDRIHEMDVATVPAAVIAAYRRTSPSEPAGMRWGVSIPGAMSRQLNAYLAEKDGGSLIIGGDGKLRLEE